MRKWLDRKSRGLDDNADLHAPQRHETYRESIGDLVYARGSFVVEKKKGEKIPRVRVCLWKVGCLSLSLCLCLSLRKLKQRDTTGGWRRVHTWMNRHTDGCVRAAIRYVSLSRSLSGVVALRNTLCFHARARDTCLRILRPA